MRPSEMQLIPLARSLSCIWFCLILFISDYNKIINQSNAKNMNNMIIIFCDNVMKPKSQKIIEINQVYLFIHLFQASLAAAVAAASSINSGVPSPYSTAGAAQYSNTGTIFSSAAAGTTSTATAPYNSAATAQYRPSAGAPSNHISVINTRQSNLISIPIHGNGNNKDIQVAI